MQPQCIFTTTRTCIVNIFFISNEIAICHFKRVLGWTCFYPGRWAVEFEVFEYLCEAFWLDTRNKELNIRALCSARVFVHDFNILTPGEAAHRVPGPVRPGLAIISPRSDVSPGRRVLGHGHTDIGDTVTIYRVLMVRSTWGHHREESQELTTTIAISAFSQ